ncbi:sulfurtransferase [Methanobacterium sp. ACI-7]|uniref:sulfurtransferase n=1 Tax=unclassified Methanobacterium TaxID=2627676 RepID=UPI0039C2E72B
MITGIHSKGDGKIKWASTDWLENNLDEKIMILDAQPDIHDYIKEHIPGACYFNEWFLRQMLGNIPGSYIPQDAIQAIFRKQGINRDIPTIVYTGRGAYFKRGDGWGQSMTAYSLARFGHNDIYLLDGGIDKWKEEEKELTKVFPTIKESKFEPILREDYYVTYEEFKAIKDNDDVVVLDARPFKYYSGPSMWIKHGHIPGAKHLQAVAFMHSDNRQLLKTEDEITSLAEECEATPDKTIICYCGTGREATNLFVVFKWFLGYEKVKIYEGSITEWTQRDDNPTVTGPNPY